MARRNFVGSFRLLVLFCSVAYSTQKPQDKPNARTGLLEPVDTDNKDEDRSGYLSNFQQQGLQHYLSPKYPATAKGECLYPDQRLYLVDEWGQCQVCICVQRFYSNNLLEPVCGHCNQCGKTHPDNPVTVLPSLPTAPPPPQASPSPPPRCDPLPTNQFYPNPLDPCQVCMCKQTEDMFGLPLPPVIECKDNHQCVIPATHPPPPPGQPAALPVCNYYPQNVVFPHPQYSCLLCKCEGPSLLHMQPSISCYPDPSCESTPAPYPMPTTPALPTPQPQPSKNVDPLPGPSPHPSCRPFTPNRPFQHPWDVCLECVCTEANAGDLTNVQVNCFTKPECCIVPPESGSYISYPGPVISSQALPAPQGQSMYPTIAHGFQPQRDASLNAMAEANAHAAGEIGAQAQATADLAAQAQLANQYSYPQQGQYGGTESYASASALAQAQANQAQNQALTQALAQAHSQVQPNYNNYPTSYGMSGAYSNAQTNSGYNAFLQPNLHTQPNQYIAPSSSFEPNSYYYNRSPGFRSAIDVNANEPTAYSQADASAQREAIAQAEALAQAEASLAHAYAQNDAAPYQYLLPNSAPYYTKSNGYGTAFGNDLTALRTQNGEAYGLSYAMPSSVQLQTYSTAQAQSDIQRGAQTLGNQELVAKAVSNAQANAASQQLQPNSFYEPIIARTKSASEVDDNINFDRAAQGQSDALAQRAAAQAQADAIAQIMGDKSQALTTANANVLRADSTPTQPTAAATLKSGR